MVVGDAVSRRYAPLIGLDPPQCSPKKNCVLTLTLAAPPGSFASRSADGKIVVTVEAHRVVLGGVARKDELDVR